MLHRFFSCFMFLCLGLAVAMLVLFSTGILPQYQETLTEEIQSLTNMQDEALLNGVLSPIEHTIAQIVASDKHDLAVLAGRADMELRDVVDAYHYLDSLSSLSGLYYSIDVYFPASGAFLSSCFGLIDRGDSRAAKYFPWAEAYAADEAVSHLHISGYDVDLLAARRQLIAFSKPLLLSDGVAFEPCVIAFSMEKSKLFSVLSLQQDAASFYLEDSCGHRAVLQENGPANSTEMIASPSGQDGFRVLRTLPPVFQSRINDLLLMFVAGLAVALVVSCLAGYLMSYRISAPLRVLVRHLRRRYDESLEPKQNELAFILHSVSGLSEHADRLEASLRQSRLIARQNFLHALLLGAAGTAQDIQRSIEQCALTFAWPNFSVVVVQFGEGVVSMMDGKDLQLLRASILSRLTGYSRDEMVIHIIETETQALHLLVNHRQPNIEHCLKDILEECFGRDSSALHSVSSGVSQPVLRLEDIAGAFRQAADARQQHFFFPEQNFFVYPVREAPLPEKCVEARHAFIKALDAQNISGALEILLQVAETVRDAGLCLSAQTKLNVLQEYWQLLNSLTLPDLLSAPEAYSNIGELCQSLRRAIDCCHDRAEQAKAIRRQQQIGLVTAFVDEHLADALSLSEAADHIGLSASYLSKIFKEIVGENFNEYVNMRRLLRAQQLLINTDSTIDEIARSLGFSSSNYFIKRFKQHFGITPAAYRAQQINQGQE